MNNLNHEVVWQPCWGSRRKRRNAAKCFSDIELITVVLIGEANGQRKGKMLYRWVGCQFPGWFPQMPEWSRFLKRWKALTEVIDWMRIELQHREGIVHDPHLIIDTMSIAVCTLVVYELFREIDSGKNCGFGSL